MLWYSQRLCDYSLPCPPFQKVNLNSEAVSAEEPHYVGQFATVRVSLSNIPGVFIHTVLHHFQIVNITRHPYEIHSMDLVV